METVTIIKHFDIPDDVTPGIVPGSINDIRGPFGFKGVEKTFHHGIVPAIAPLGSCCKSCRIVLTVFGIRYRRIDSHDRSDELNLFRAFGASKP